MPRIGSPPDRRPGFLNSAPTFDVCQRPLVNAPPNGDTRTNRDVRRPRSSPKPDSRYLGLLGRPARAFRRPCKVSDFEDYLLTGHRLSMGFAGSAVISRAEQ
jgi:hypothetical protein